MTIEKLDQRIEELKAANVADREQLGEKEKEYEKAVNAFQSNKIDSLHAEITAIKSAMENRIKQIAILVSPDNPIRVQAKADHFKAVESERDAAKAKADALSEKLLKAQAEYCRLANEIYPINKEYNAASRKYHHVSGDRKPYFDTTYLVPSKYEIKSKPVQNTRSDYEFKGGNN